MSLRILRLAAAVFFCLAMTACGSTSETTPTGGTMVVNPIQEKASLDEINSAIGCAMKAPEGLTVSGEKFFVIAGAIGEYRFAVDDISYTLRASATSDDISGVYADGKGLGDVVDIDKTDTVIFDGGLWTRWFMGDMQYSLLSNETDAKDTAALYSVRDALR